MSDPHAYLTAVEKQAKWHQWVMGNFINVLTHKMAISDPEHFAGVDARTHSLPFSAGAVFYVEPEICDLVRAAAKSLPTDTALESTLWPADTGFLWLGRVLEPHASAICWHPSLDGAAMSVYFYEDCIVDPKKLYDPPMLLTSVATLRHGQRIDSDAKFNRLNRDAALLHDGPTDKDYARAVKEMVSTAEGPINAIAPEGAFVYALLLFMNQKLLKVTPAPIPRPQRRRIARAGIERDNVQVIHLRRTHYEERPADGDHDPVEWSCRWLVRGHWRQQWYATTQVHRPIWILPFVKGPDDKPVKDDVRRIFSVDR